MGRIQANIDQIACSLNAAIQIAPFAVNPNERFVDMLELTRTPFALGSDLLNQPFILGFGYLVMTVSHRELSGSFGKGRATR